MNIQRWLESRRKRGTNAYLARRIAVSDKDYENVERQIRRLHVLEVLIANGGKHGATAVSLGVHRHTIGRCLKALGVSSEQVKVLAKQLNK